METFDLDRPNVVATVTQAEDLTFLAKRAAWSDVDVLEFRLDNLVLEDKTVRVTSDRCNPYSFDLANFEDALAAGPTVLVTARHPAEGGAGNLDEAHRVRLYQELFDRASLVDTELQSLESEAMRACLADWQQVNGNYLVASFHNFDTCPERQELFQKAEQAYQLGADVFKVAAVVETFPELNRLVELVESFRNQGQQISAMGMGSLGKLSRLVLARAGSCLNYGYLQKENAPGQWSASELKQLLAKL